MGQQEDAPQVKIAVLNNDVKHMNETLVRIESKFDNAIQGFVTFDKLADAQKSSEEKHLEIDKHLQSLDNWNTWAARLIIAGVVTFVIYAILQSGLFLHN